MITTNTGAKKLESSDNWREIFPDNQGAQGAHNASVGAHDAAISQMCQTINGTFNNSGHTINAGEYFIANGGKYKATASIPVNEAWSGSAQPVSDNDLINALNNSLESKISGGSVLFDGEFTGTSMWNKRSQVPVGITVYWHYDLANVTDRPADGNYWSIVYYKATGGDTYITCLAFDNWNGHMYVCTMGKVYASDMVWNKLF